ncbi:MAG TPA: hypothetical protein VHV56_08960 [Pseudolabrys sp.]|jgi:hypothetical protein|nr:hypothetical protein [Pseudolabrys sp.]
MEALEHWHDFYLLVGTAGATLLALLFVAVSLGAGFLSDTHTAPTRAFYSPVIVHFTSVFFLSAIALIPSHKPVFFAAVIGATAVLGAAISVLVTVALLTHDWTHYQEDRLAYGLLPVAGYAALFTAAVMIVQEFKYALDVLAAALLLLLIVNIRNAWDLTLSMVRRQTEREREKRKQTKKR